MLRTILIGSCVSVQGLFVSQGPDGKVTVNVDGDRFTGKPVAPVREIVRADQSAQSRATTPVTIPA